jgi:predicted DNA-binding transcriptional regulator AlpA
MVKQLTDGDLPHERWIRLPSTGYCPFTGLSRSGYYRAIARGAIKSANIKQPGEVRGIRVVWLPSALAYVERHVEKGA